MDQQKNKVENKESVWKYVSFIFAVILIVGAVVYFTRGSEDTTGKVIKIPSEYMTEFTSNQVLYPSIGPKDAEVTILEFSDFQCPYCALASGFPAFGKEYSSKFSDLIGSAGKVEKLAKAGKVRFIFIPMSFLGAESGYAAQAALCANEQGKFFEMHDLIFAAHDGEENNGKFSKDNLKPLAEKVSGLDTAKFNECLTSGKYSSKAQEINKAANSAGVKGTPVFFINGEQTQASWTQISQKLKALGVDTV